MKKYLLSVFAAASMLFAASSCSEDQELLTGGNGNSEKVSFQVMMEGNGPASRADLNVGEGTKADILYYEVIDKNTGEKVYDATAPIAGNMGEDKTKRGANLTLDLVKGVPYDILFWAHNDANSVFNVEDLQNVTMKTSELKANMEDYDAFTAALNGYKVQSGSKTIVPLKRPFAQVNVGTTETDWNKAVGLKVVIDQTEMTVKGVNTVYNVATATASEPKDLTYVLNALVDQDNKLKIQRENEEPQYYHYLGLNYMLADAESSMKNMEFELHAGGHLINTIKVHNLPIRRNYRTNVIGNLLTSNEGFEVVIDASFKGDYFETAWDGSVKKPEFDESNKIWTIKSASELAWIAGAVNGTLEANERSASEPKNFLGETVKLANDIDLQNHGWMPIGHGGDSYKVNFQGTFDGQEHTIYNLNVTNESSAGLFGNMVKGTIKNVNIKNVTIKTNHYAGAIVGWAEQGGGDIVIENCHVDGGSITVAPDFDSNYYDNGDKAGGIVGFLYAGKVEECSVENLSITAYRDLAGIAGYASKATVINNAVNNVSIVVDQSANPYKDAPKAANAGEIIGRTGDANVTTPDNTSDNVTFVSKIGSIDASLATEPVYDEQTKTVTADNAQEFLWFLHKVNGTLPTETAGRAASELDAIPNSFADHTFELTCNVDLGGIEWTPIGTKASHFKGAFKGNGYTISNFKITGRNSDGNQAALFGTVSGSPTFENFTIENVNIVYPNDGGDFYAAALVGTYYGDVTVKDVKVTGSNITGNNKVAGLMAHDGVCSSLNIENCHVENSTIASTNKADGGNVGGLLGLINAGAEYNIKNSSVKNCVIKGVNPENKGKRSNGEFIGCVGSKANQKVIIEDCIVEGNEFTQIDQNGNDVTYESPYAPYEKYIGGVREDIVEGSKVIINGFTWVANGCWLKESTYYVSNAKGLKWVADVVNATTPYTPTIFDNATVELVCDIDLQNEEWTPIGDDRSQRTEWHGIFDGKGYTVSNIKITKKTDREDENKSSYGLFGNVKGTVKNLTVENVSISGAPKFIGALIGRLNDGLVENCHVKNSAVECNNWTIGGLIGQFNNGKISRCTVENTTVKGYAAVGAITGIALNTGERTIEDCSVSDCILDQNGSFGGDYEKMFGAVVGALYNGDLSVNINNCVVEGTTIKGVSSNELCGYVSEGDKLIIDGYEQIVAGLGYNATKKEYAISSAEGLVAMSDIKIKGGEKILLDANIDLKDVEFNGLSAFNSENNNTFDGMGFTVSNWTNNSGASDMGFFKSWVGTIKNIKFENCHLKTAGRSAIVAANTYTQIESISVNNCSIEDSYWACGIIAGLYNSGSVSNCTVTNSSVKSNGGTGGIVGVFNETGGKRALTNCSVSNSTINNTGAYGENYTGGGLIGIFNCNAEITIENCNVSNNTLEGNYIFDKYPVDETVTIIEK